jgi:hypothetical protein
MDFESVRRATAKLMGVGTGDKDADPIASMGSDFAETAGAIEAEAASQMTDAEKRKMARQAAKKQRDEAKAGRAVARGMAGMKRHPGGRPGVWSMEYDMVGGNMYREGMMDDDSGSAFIKFSDGSLYRGELRDGRITGRGRYETATGEVFEGVWKDGVLSGEGSHTTPDGVVEQGTWRLGELHGRGVQMWGGRGGDVYVGGFRDGARWGRGRLITRGGTAVYDGSFQAGLRDGRGSQSWYRLVIAMQQARAEAAARRKAEALGISAAELPSSYWWGDDDPEAWAATTVSGRWKAGHSLARSCATYMPWPSVALHADRPAGEAAARLIRAVYGGRGLRPRPLRSVVGMLRDSVTSAAALKMAGTSSSSLMRLLNGEDDDLDAVGEDNPKNGEEGATMTTAMTTSTAVRKGGPSKVDPEEVGVGAASAVVRAAEDGVVMWMSRGADGSWVGGAPEEVFKAMDALSGVDPDAPGGKVAEAVSTGVAPVGGEAKLTSAGYRAAIRGKISSGAVGERAGIRHGVRPARMPLSEALAVYAMGVGSGVGTVGGGIIGVGGVSLAEISTMRDRVLRARQLRQERQERRVGLMTVLGRGWFRHAVAERRSAQARAEARDPAKIRKRGEKARLRVAAQAVRRLSAMLGKPWDGGANLGEIAGRTPEMRPRALGGVPVPAAEKEDAKTRRKRDREERKQRLRAALLAGVLGPVGEGGEGGFKVSSTGGVDAATEAATVYAQGKDGVILGVGPAAVAKIPMDALLLAAERAGREELEEAEKILADATKVAPVLAPDVPPAAGASALVRSVETTAGKLQAPPTLEGQPRVPELALRSTKQVNQSRSKPRDGFQVWSRFGQRALGSKQVESAAIHAGRVTAKILRADRQVALLEATAGEGDLVSQLNRAKELAGKVASAGANGHVEDQWAEDDGKRIGSDVQMSAMDTSYLDEAWLVDTSSGKLLPNPASLVRLFDLGKARASAVSGSNGRSGGPEGGGLGMLAPTLRTAAGGKLGEFASTQLKDMVGAQAAAAGGVKSQGSKVPALLGSGTIQGIAPGSTVADVAGPLGGTAAATLLVGEIAASAARVRLLQSRRGTRRKDYGLSDAPQEAQGPPSSSFQGASLQSIKSRLAADLRLRYGAGLADRPGELPPLAGGDKADDVGGVDWMEAMGEEHRDVDEATRFAAGASLGVPPVLPARAAALATTAPALAGRFEGRRKEASRAAPQQEEPTMDEEGVTARTGPSTHRSGALSSARTGREAKPPKGRSDAIKSAELSTEQRQEAQEEEMLARFPPMSRRHERKVSVAVAARGDPDLYFAGDGHVFEGSNRSRRVHPSDSLKLLRQYEIAVQLAHARVAREGATLRTDDVAVVREANVEVHNAHWMNLRANWRTQRDFYHFGKPQDAGPGVPNTPA